MESEYQIPDKAGNLIWVRFSTKALFEGGQFKGGTGTLTNITEKKRYELALQKSEERYLSILNASPDAIVNTDLNGQILFSSPRTYKMLKYSSAEDIIHHHFKEFIDLADHPKIEASIQSKYSGTFSGSNEYTLIRSDDSKLEVEINLSFINDEAGKPIQIMFVCRDISARRAAELRVRQSEENFRNLVESINDVIYDITPSGVIKYFSPSIERVIGYKAEELIGQNIFRFIHPDDAALVKEKLRNLNKRDYSYLEYRIVAKSGEVSWIRSSTTALMENGRITGGTGSFTDVTMNKKAEREIRELNATLEFKINERTSQLAQTNLALQEEIVERQSVQTALSKSEHSYRSVVENIKETVFRTDTDGRWDFLNKSWKEITGFNVEESLGKQVFEYIYPDDRQLLMDQFDQLISNKVDHCCLELRYLTREGGFRWVEMFARTGLDENDQITGTYGTFNDITERKRAEAIENALLQLSPNLTGIPVDEIDSALNLALSRIGQFLAMDRSYIFIVDQDQQTFTNTHEWCNEGITHEKENLLNVPFSEMPLLMEQLLRNENIIIPDVNELPESWKLERKVMEGQGIKSMVTIPVFLESGLMGFVGLDAVHERKEIIPVEINILKVWRSMIASLLKNKQNENLLDQIRKNYETFFNTIDDFLWVLDNQGNVIYTNNSVLQRLGYSLSELKGQPFQRVVPEEKREETWLLICKILAGTADLIPVPLVAKSGQHIQVETRVKAGFWDGKPVIFGVSKDVSLIKLSEEKFSKAFHNNSVIMSISRYDNGKYIDVNDTFLRTLGYSKSEVIGKSARELDVFLDYEQRVKIVQSLSENLSVREFEAVVRTKTGELLDGLISADFMYIADQLCVLMVMVDITIRKQAEMKMKEARKEADEANLAKSEFLSRMSHELRTPLNSILGFAQLMEMSKLLPGQEKGLGYIRQNGKHLLNLINEVLDISRIESGHLSLSIEPVLLHSVLQEMVEITRPLTRTLNLTLELESHSGSRYFVNADRQKLKQVLLNLLNNAIKYNRLNGSVRITTAAREEKVPGFVMVRISIIDTGQGIRTTDIPKLFRPFERIGAERSETEGTGLGLALVKKLLDAMGGFIGVESTLGKGSTFWIELPMVENQLHAIEEGNGLTDGEVTSATPNGTILYIEDNNSNLELVRQILTTMRASLRLITNMKGRQALPISVKYRPDLILLDLDLPDIHGSEVVQMLKGDPRTSQIPIVIISADATSGQVNNLRDLGIKYYLTKPLDIVRFLEVVDEYMKFPQNEVL